jgi:hypothetical protein
MAKDASGGLGDVDGLVADAFEIIVDAGNGKDEPEINGHQLMEREKLENAVVDFKLEFVDGVFFIENATGELFVGFENGVDGLVDGALGETAHPQEALFQLVQIFFEMAFHELFPLSSLLLRVRKKQIPRFARNDSHGGDFRDDWHRGDA